MGSDTNVIKIIYQTLSQQLLLRFHTYTPLLRFSCTLCDLKDFSFRYRTSSYISVISPVASGLAWVSPEPDLPLPSLGIARDFKRYFPMQHNDNGNQTRHMYSIYTNVVEHVTYTAYIVTCSNTYNSKCSNTYNSKCSNTLHISHIQLSVRTLPTECV